MTVDTIAAAGDKLWKELIGTNVATKVNHLSLGFTGLESSEVGQRSIVGFLKAGQASKRPRDESGSNIDDDSYTPLESRDSDVTRVDLSEGDHTLSFTCDRCAKTFSPDSPLSGLEAEAALAVLRQEHDDFHFAQDLAKEQQHPDSGLVISGPSKAKPSSSKLSPKKKRRKDPPSHGGIERFFGR